MILLLRKRRLSLASKERGGEIGVDKVKKTLATIDELCELNLPYFEGRIPFIYFFQKTFKNLVKLTLWKSNSTPKHIHIVGYCGSTRLIELMYVVLCKIRFPKAKVNFELRGGFVQNTGKGKLTLRMIECFSDSIFTQISLHTYGQNFKILPNFYKGNANRPVEFNSLKIGYLGSLQANKGIMTLARAVKEYNAKYGSIELIVGGEGPLKNDLCEFIENENLQDKIVFLGNIERSDITEFWSQVNFFFFPSSNPYEGQSNALTEAITLGVVPFASDIPANRASLKYQEHLFTELSADVIKEKIEYARSNYSLINDRMTKLRMTYNENNFTNILIGAYE